MRLLLLLRRFGRGKAHHDTRAAPPGRWALRVYLAAHRLGEAATDRQAEAGSSLTAFRAAAAIEFLENALEIGWFHAGTFVADADDDIAAVAPRMNDRSRIAAIFVSIVDEIEQNLFEEIGVATDEGQIAREIGRYLLIGKCFARPLDRAAHDVGDIDVVALGIERPRFDA